MLYTFHFVVEGSPPVVSERRHMDSDKAARLRAIGELLQMPHRLGVEVWQGECMIYSRMRGAPASETGGA